ncbi:hypothetical protein BG011_002707 [Mortierella polycephala]|uniref:LYC1 C-terminal domain-containing protein n=1 Tax=Mortierella polycephala TaxID=41804 RepID=A0A9P6QHV6_9FUNG|nr:hypothetical protein BG011_002707 [Mortierella polycephala]
MQDLELIRTTNPKVIRQVWLNNRSFFGPKMSDELWLENSALRMDQDYGLGKEFKIWILVPKGEGDDPKAILSAVHTYDRPGLISRSLVESGHAGTQRDVEVDDILVAYVLLVFTPVEHRKRGYAKTLLRMLWGKFNSQTEPLVELTFLYSALGTDFYESLGWHAVRSKELVLPVTCHVFPKLAKRTARDHSLEDLTESHLQVITDKDIRLLRAELKLRAIAAPQNTRVAAILPEERCFHRALAKARFTLSKVARIARPFRRIGVRLNNGPEDEDAYVLWTFIEGSRQLLILRARYRTVDQIQCLLKEAMSEAREWNMRTVAIWDMNDCDALAATGILNQDRVNSWSCVGQFRHGPVDPGTGSPRVPVELMANEGFVWT